MKLLLDANVSWRICKPLLEFYENVVHAEFVLGEMVSDISIWNYAKTNSYSIVTNDEDFINIMNIYGQPPKIILLKTGNQSNEYIKNVLISHHKDILQIEISDTIGLIELF